jgi:hypothetical protein
MSPFSVNHCLRAHFRTFFRGSTPKLRLKDVVPKQKRVFFSLKIETKTHILSLLGQESFWTRSGNRKRFDNQHRVRSEETGAGFV